MENAARVNAAPLAVILAGLAAAGAGLARAEEPSGAAQVSPAQAQSRARVAQFERRRDELSFLMDELSDRIKRLEVLRTEYLGGGFNEARTERERLLGEFRPLFKRFRDAQSDFNRGREMHMALDVLQGRRELAGVGAKELVHGFDPEKRKLMPAPDGSWLQAWHDLDGFRDTLTEFRGRTRTALLADESAFKAAEAAHQARKRWALRCLALMLAAAAIGAALLYRRRTR